MLVHGLDILSINNNDDKTVMEISFAREEDLEAIVAIYNQAVLAGASGDLEPLHIEDRRLWFAGHQPDEYPILVGREGGGIRGWVSLSAYRPGRLGLRHTAEISYFVHEHHFRKGIATKLVEAAISSCPELQITTLFAIILEDNRASVGLLERFGFRKWGYLPRVAIIQGRELGHLYYGLNLPK